jgi:site-specific DNA-methyltransferase (cytosine-N4-specific)
VSLQQSIKFSTAKHDTLIERLRPYYKTEFGIAYHVDSLEVLKDMPDNKVDLVVTSPPYALHFKKEYGNPKKSDYVKWFLPFAEQILRILKEDGSFVLNIGGSYNKGEPTKSLYHFKLLIALVEEIGFYLAQECFWYNPAKMPVPAEWVTVRRVRIKESVEYVWWFSKSPHPKANNTKVLRPYSDDMIRLNKKGVRETVRPSGHLIRSSFKKIESGGAIPSNVIEENGLAENMLRFGNNSANDKYTLRCKEAGYKLHPARFPAALPEFFIKLLTDSDDIVVDPFAGSNVTGAVAERLQRKWIAIECEKQYLETSKFRFDQIAD